MVGESKCNGCGPQKRLWYEIIVEENNKKKYCRACYQLLYLKLKCRFCGEEMIKDYYYTYLSDLHPK